MRHIWHKNTQKGWLKLLAPFKEQDVFQTTDTGSVPGVAVTSLSGCTHCPCRGRSWGQEMVCRTLHPMFLYCLSVPSDTRSKMQNAFHAVSVNCSLCLYPSFLPAVTQGNPGLECVAVELHSVAVLKRPPGKRKRAWWPPDDLWRSWLFKWVYSLLNISHELLKRTCLLEAGGD